MGRKEEYKEKNLQYLQVLSTQEGICPLPCNMFYKVLQTGTGTVSPTIRSIVTVHYRGSLINGKEFEENSSGDGQYDAFVRALRKIYKVTLGRKFPMLTNYAVSIPPGGRTDAFVQTVITWSFEEKVFRTRGLDADQTEAAIKATMKMLNIIENEYENNNG